MEGFLRPFGFVLRSFLLKVPEKALEDYSVTLEQGQRDLRTAVVQGSQLM